MKPMHILLLALAAVNVSVAQPVEGQIPTTTPRQPAYGDLKHSDLSPVPIASRSKGSWDALRMRYGAFGSVNFNHHVANFQTLPGIPNCCSRFSDGSGTGGSVGALIEIPVAEKMVLSFRGGYTSNIARLQSDEHTVVFVDTAAVPALFTHTIDASPGILGLTPSIGYRVAGSLWLHGGTEFGYMIKKHYAQEERLIEPSVGQFSDGKRTRNVFSGDIPKANPLQSSLVLGTSYEFPLNRRETVLAAPEFYYSVGLTNLVEGLSWKANSARLGMAVKYSPRPEGQEPPQPIPGVLAAGVTAVSVQADGREIPMSTMYIEETVTTNMRPLLNYVFFNEGSASIPSRYHRLSSTDADKFHNEDLFNAQTMPTYYQMLNVIGRRLRENPAASISIVGCNANSGPEQGNRELSMQRADAVRSYFRDVWHIADNRMSIDARNLPEKPSSPNDPDGAAENRRVEILASDARIVEPIFTADTVRRAQLPTIRFQPTVRSETGVAEWSLAAVQNGKTLRTFRGSGDVPAVLDWDVEAEQISAPRAGSQVDYQLEVVDLAGQVTTTPVGSIPVELTPAQKRIPNTISYKEVDRYSLILFDFNRAELNGVNSRIIDRLRNRISPSATVTVTGYTDRIGEADYNKKLSEERARMVASMLNAPSTIVSGVGESAPLYNNDLPEGRYYNRTVDVLVETPIKH